jgi:hypothetical protein
MVDDKCSDGVSGTDLSQLHWQFRADGNTLTITPEGGKCDSFTAAISDDHKTAQVTPKTCPPIVEALDQLGDTFTYVPHIAGGTLGLELNDTITVKDFATDTSNLNGEVVCAQRWTDALHRVVNP